MSREHEMELPPGNTLFPASEVRPDGFPADLPFVPGVQCHLIETHRDQGLVTCSWNVSEPDHHARAEAFRARTGELIERALKLPIAQEWMERAPQQPLPPGSWEERKSAGEQMRADMERMLERASPGETESLLALFNAGREAMRPGAAAAEEIERVQQILLDESLADGWSVMEESTLPMLDGGRIVKLSKPGRSRTISVLPMALGSSVLLSDQSA